MIIYTNSNTDTVEKNENTMLKSGKSKLNICIGAERHFDDDYF